MPMAAARSSNSYDPLCRRPLMKNVGVPFTPLRTPPRKSLRTLGTLLAAYQRIAQSRFGQDGVLQRARTGAADRGDPGSSQECASCISQNPAVRTPRTRHSRRRFGHWGGFETSENDERQSQRLAEMLLDKLDDRMRQSAESAFVVAVFDERDRRPRLARGYDQPA